MPDFHRYRLPRQTRPRSPLAEWPRSTFKSCVERSLHPQDRMGAGNNQVSEGEPTSR